LSVSSPKTSASAPTTDEKTFAFLRNTFRESEFRHNGDVEVPSEIQAREFGYIPFGKGMIRHLSYKFAGELAADLVKQAPSSVFCSNATYSNPTLPMDEKGWKGAELIFDIDANSIPTSCRARHSFWTCNSCGKVIRLAERPQRCPKCEGTSITHLHWSCAECLAASKDHAARLVSFLTDDFGVPGDSIRVYFSGNRGFHLHVGDPRFEAMEPAARAEVSNYIKGTGLRRPEAIDEEASVPMHGGWPDRIASLGNQDQPLRMEQILNALGSKIDESVTTDVHRIFRMPGTLHGNSGLLKMRVHDLEGFRPEYDPVVLGEEPVAVYVQGAPVFNLRGRAFGPYSDEEPEIPLYAAAYLMTKGLARVAE